MITPIYHPDIDEYNGDISLPIYDSSFITIIHAVEVIIDALREPNPFSPQNYKAAELLIRDVHMFKEEVHRRIIANKLNL